MTAELGSWLSHDVTFPSPFWSLFLADFCF